MNRILQNMVRPAAWLIRFRHRCGYGVHSPFAFNFITQVVYESGEYYAYCYIRNTYRQHKRATPLRLKDVLLLFRLSNYQQPTVCRIWGATAESIECHALRCGCRHTAFVFADEKKGYPAEMILALNDWQQNAAALTTALTEGGMLVVYDIWSTAERRRAWKYITESPESIVSFNLRDFGIALRRTSLKKDNYTVNYY